MALNSKRILMTGANGYIGSVITMFARNQGYEVHGLVRSKASEDKVRTQGAVPVRGGLDNLETLAREAAAADIVMHLANPIMSDFTLPFDEVKRIDFAAVDAMANAMKGTRKPLVVANGSAGLLPGSDGGEVDEESRVQDPNNPIDRDAQANHALRWVAEGVAVTVLRIAPYVYGRGGGSLAMLMQMSASKGYSPITVIDGGKTRTSSVHVDDVARLFLLAGEKSPGGE